MYARSFMWIVDKCNETLDVKTVKRAYFIGVLDIAGFETFEENGFEQLCINFTNERLQQYFNNFMFVLEQEEYAKEGIVWEMMSFGADLQATIDLIDKPMGIFSMLEEECVVPKGTDMTYKEKMYAKHLGKHPSFGKPKPSKSKYEAHFELKHYAGVVAYGVNGWLDKNKDPINEFVAAMFKAQQQNQLLSFLFREIGVEVAASGGKKGSQTISANHREQLNKLMKTLGATHPHFVRCIIPNEIKTGGIIDAHLVMHQLHCNGVLEGIRICRKGFPSRILYLEFIQRYSILNPTACKGVTEKDAAKKATSTILEGVKMDPELYRIGLTKVLFKAGVLGTLEEYRDNAISGYLIALQSQIRCYLMVKNVQNMIDQKKSIGTLQKNIRLYLILKNWPWWNLMTFVKPLLQGAKKEVSI
jgi:myosin heavy subunit